MVSFRLSEQEYQHLITLCTERGARSLSDLARDAMQGLLITEDHKGNGLRTEVEKLTGRIEEFERELKRLVGLVGNPSWQFCPFSSVCGSCSRRLSGQRLHHGPGDQIVIHAPNAEEIDGKTIHIGTPGNINLPLVGRIEATGLTSEQLEDSKDYNECDLYHQLGCLHTPPPSADE
jgi:hypothetical protein